MPQGNSAQSKKLPGHEDDYEAKPPIFSRTNVHCIFIILKTFINSYQMNKYSAATQLFLTLLLQADRMTQFNGYSPDKTVTTDVKISIF